MRLLLDTQCLLWWFAQPERLNASAIKHIGNEANELWFSAASVWEISIKSSIGKLPLPEPVEDYVPSRVKAIGAETLPIFLSHALRVAILPLHHRDPFDRVLVAQAQVEGFCLVSSDSVLAKYKVDLLWAAS